MRRLKGPKRPVNGLADRAAVIAAVESVDAVISFDEETPLELIRRLKPDVLVKGGDYTVETVVGAEEVQEAGGRVVLVDLVEGHSTTGLIDAIRDRARARTPPDAGACLMLVITGGGGFIGSVLAAALNEAGRSDLVIVDRFGSDDKWRNIAKRDFYEIVPVDGAVRLARPVRRGGRGGLSSRRDLGDDLRRRRRDDRQQPQLLDRAVALVRRERARS